MPDVLNELIEHVPAAAEEVAVFAAVTARRISSARRSTGSEASGSGLKPSSFTSGCGGARRLADGPRARIRRLSLCAEDVAQTVAARSAATARRSDARRGDAHGPAGGPLGGLDGRQSVLAELQQEA